MENKVFAAARPEGLDGGLGYEVTLRHAIESALPYVETSFRDQPLIEARLRATLGASFIDLGEYKAAADQYEKSRTLYTQQLGPDHPDTLRSCAGLATCYGGLGRRTESVKLFQETLARQEAKVGPSHRDTLLSMSRLANTYSLLGKLQLAAAGRSLLRPPHLACTIIA